MNFYIDFEATQYDHKIISIGCVNDAGDSFYSLVKPQEKTKVTPFITNLTGIMQEMVDNAPSAETVFARFKTFIDIYNHGESTFFFVYGNEDQAFLERTAKKVMSKDIRRFMNYLAGSLIDYSKITRDYFQVSQVGLKRALNYFKEEPIVQKHDALEDAEMLMELYKYIENSELIQLESCPFEDIKNTTNNSSSEMEGRIKSGDMIFENLDEAANWVKDNLIGDKVTSANIQNIKKKIKYAINHKKKYFLKKWRLVQEEVND